MASRTSNPRSSAKRPAHAVEQEVFISVLKLADALTRQAEQRIRPSGLSGAQYNVLRILRGAAPQGLACREIAERMISHDPDITRLLDRMEKRQLITRERQTDDRRVIKTRITTTGLAALAGLDEPVGALHKRQFEHMSAARLRTLANLLQEATPGNSQNAAEVSDFASPTR
jgi:DNA-binding MarR family transcriptional regulator